MRPIHCILLLLLLTLSACNDEIILKDEVTSAMTVPISIQIGSAETVTKASPLDGTPIEDQTPTISGESSVDKVRIVAFKRSAGATSSFTYDVGNDRIIDCVEENGIHIARSSFIKESGFEYRVIAFGYSVANKENDMFSLTPANANTTYDEFKLSIASTDTTIQNGLSLNYNKQNIKKVREPEIFYGYCHSGDGNSIITGENLVQLTGVLYRCVGKVTIRINNVKQSLWNFYWFTLLAETVYSESMTTNYADFRTPFTRISSPDYKNNPYPWVEIARSDFIDNNGDPVKEPGTVIMSAFLLPTETKLRIRMKSALLGVVYINEYELFFNDLSSAENATGIISSVSNNNKLYIRRNKCYTITGEYTTLINNEVNL